MFFIFYHLDLHARVCVIIANLCLTITISRFENGWKSDLPWFGYFLEKYMHVDSLNEYLGHSSDVDYY